MDIGLGKARCKQLLIWKIKKSGTLRHPLKLNKCVCKGVILASRSVLIIMPMNVKEHCKTI